MWAAIIVTAVGCYLLKLAGLSVPDRVLDRPLVRRIAYLIPVALLGALVAVQAFSTGHDLTVALLAKAPFLVVVIVAAATTALIRLAI